MRHAVAVLLLVAMVVFGVEVYAHLGSLKTRTVVTATAKEPARVKPKFSLPGTIVVAQDGTLYRLHQGLFQKIASGGWTQPAISPDHTQLVAVSRSWNKSDLFLLDLDGQVIRQLTRNGSRVVPYNHWSFYPRFSPDGQTIYYAWDPKDPNNDYRVDLAIYSMPTTGPQTRAREWTYPYFYSGGDVQPVPLRSGAVLYTRFDISDTGPPRSQLWLTQRQGTLGRPLTTTEEDCSQPALSPDGTMLAMICTGGGQVGRLEVASFNGSSLGPRRILIDGQLCAAPAWSPDGTALVYFSATGASGHFQLFYLSLPVAATASPSAMASASASATTATPSPSPTPPRPVQISSELDFDPTAAPAWY